MKQNFTKSLAKQGQLRQNGKHEPQSPAQLSRKIPALDSIRKSFLSFSLQPCKRSSIAYSCVYVWS